MHETPSVDLGEALYLHCGIIVAIIDESAGKQIGYSARVLPAPKTRTFGDLPSAGIAEVDSPIS